MNGTVSDGAKVPSYLLTGKVAVVTGSGEHSYRGKNVVTTTN